ncbi:MAG: Hpt domain-containing protein, partial [Burkholderiaceae bacterium]|nr:Hpt domain-containing protein [Burkholderiaceae bacterium]
MSDMNADQSGGAGIDLSQFYQVFFEEAGENLDRMEQQLLAIDIEAADDEELNSIFRCAHSVKGGAATFGFADVAELTHQMETLLDRLRRHELEPTAPMVDVLLQSGDALRSQLARHQGAGGDPVDTSELLMKIRALVSGQALPASAPAAVIAKPASVLASTPVETTVPATSAAKLARGLELRVGPLNDPKDADNLVDLFNEIVDLGTIEPLDGGQASDGVRRFKVVTTSSDEDLLDLFTFHVAREQVALLPLTAGFGFHDGAPGAPPVENPPDPGFGFFDDAPGAPGSTAAANGSSPAPSGANSATESNPVAPTRAAGKTEKAPAAALESSTLRVSVEKVDQLINLVGELVITQAMLAQNSKQIDTGLYQQLAAGLADLDRNTRDLQESVMSIRMIPMSMV